MPSRRIILLFIAVLAMLGAKSAEGQSGLRTRTVASRVSLVKAAASTSVRSPVPFPYMQEPVRLTNASFTVTPWTRRLSPRLVIPAGDRVQGSAGLVWTQRSMYGTLEIRLLLF